MDIKIECRQQLSPYSRYSHIVLTSPVAGLFDFMRYENCFFTRRSDVAILAKAMMEGLEAGKSCDAVLKQFRIGLAKYNWPRGYFTVERLGSDQLLTAGQADVDFTGTIAKPPLRFRNIATVSGAMIDEVLWLMFSNHACPNDEESAHVLENAPYDQQKPLTVQICNYTPVQKAIWAPAPPKLPGLRA